MQGTGRMAGLVSLRSPDGFDAKLEIESMVDSLNRSRLVRLSLGSSPDAFRTTAGRLV